MTTFDRPPTIRPWSETKELVVSNFHSANGKLVEVLVERKSESGVFGRDFISGGLRDYFSKVAEGYWIVAKCDVYPSNLTEMIREGTAAKLGSYPSVMPETFVSHLAVALWEGKSDISEEDLLAQVGAAIQHGIIVQDLVALKHRESLKLLSTLGRDALVVVKEGNQKRYWDKYQRVFSLLAERGYLKEAGIRSKQYELTQKGMNAISRRISPVE